MTVELQFHICVCVALVEDSRCRNMQPCYLRIVTWIYTKIFYDRQENFTYQVFLCRYFFAFLNRKSGFVAWDDRLWYHFHLIFQPLCWHIRSCVRCSCRDKWRCHALVCQRAGPSPCNFAFRIKYDVCLWTTGSSWSLQKALFTSAVLNDIWLGINVHLRCVSCAVTWHCLKHNVFNERHHMC